MSQLDRRRFSNSSRGGRIVKKSDQIKHPSGGNGVNITKPLNANAQEFIPGNINPTPVLKATAKEFIPSSPPIETPASKMKLNANAPDFVPHKYDTAPWISHPTVYSARNGPRFPQDHSNGHNIEFEAAILPTPHGMVPIRLHNNHNSFNTPKSEDTPATSATTDVTAEDPTDTANNEEPKQSEDNSHIADKPEDEDSNEDSNTNTTTATENSDQEPEPQESESSEQAVTEPTELSTPEEPNTQTLQTSEPVNDDTNEDEYDNPEPSETDVSTLTDSYDKEKQSPKKNIKYDDGSFNPQSPLEDAKKMYTKNFLLQFKELFNEKPQNMVVLPDIVPDSESKSKKTTPRRQGGNLKNSKGKDLTSSSKGKTTKTVRKPILKEENSKDDISYKIQSILNKLTPNTYEKLFEQLKFIDISIEANMEEFIKIIFPKAVAEHRYSELYAKLCADMVKSLGSEPMKLFRKLLLSRCQREFESKPTVPELPPDSSEVAKIEHEEKATKIRLYNLGNIKFIGELFKLQMLRENIMFYCIDSFLKSKSETDLEHMCLLITTVGKFLDRGETLNKYFDRIKALSQDSTQVSRIKYMLLDIIDLRAKRWVPRREVEGPKTIQQVHDDTEKKEKEKLKSKDRDFDFNNRRPRDSKMSPSVKQLDSPRKGPQSMYSRGSSKPMTDNTKDKDNWISSRGRGRANIATPSRTAKNEGDNFNKFALLAENESPKPTKQQKGKAIANEIVVPQSIPIITPATTKSLTDDEIIEKTKSLLSDYYEEESLEEAVDRFKSHLDNCSAPHIIVNTILTFSYEKKDHERKLAVELLAGLKEFIEISSFEKVFDEILQLLPDLCYDIPKAGEFTGFFLAEGVKSGYISEQFLTPEKLKDAFLSPAVNESLLGQFFKNFQQKELQLFQKVYQPFANCIQDLLRDKNKDRFLQANNLNQMIEAKYTEPESQEEQDTEPQEDQETEPQEDQETEPQEDEETEPQEEQETEPQEELEPEPQEELEPEPQEEPEPHTEQETEAEPEPEAQEQQTETQNETEPEPEPEPEAEPEPEPVVSKSKTKKLQQNKPKPKNNKKKKRKNP